MLEITGDHVAKLNDEDLRTLVARLCEAELRRNGLPISAVSAGGDQNAADGGVDVCLSLAAESESLDFIPRSITGFQVKCSDMPAGAIALEMRPRGVLRPSILELAKANGSYVIVSSQGSTADSALQNRKKAMQQAVGDLPEGVTIHLDFYDRDRLARWVRSYPGVDLWLREHIGEPLSGWQSYGSWAYGDLANSEYLLDEKARIVSRTTGSREALSVEKGIAAMRNVLAEPGGIVRLIGLSGTGKTRLVQALFDSRLGEGALDRSIVLYTDQGQEPTPSARDMIHRLAASGLRAVVVVDNCNPESHRILAQMIGTNNSQLSLITVEYDVADDEPEETQVFLLEPASEQVVEEILKRLCPQLSQTDRQRIAEFSGGNARIALTLARTVKSHETLGRLNDLELFKRLFYQRQGGGESLMRAAEACALVYSFDGETLDGDDAELSVLAQLADLPIRELYRQVDTLRSRDLVQRRNRWRAVLPQAIANRLARQALERIPPDLVIQTFSPIGRERLLKSFSRRLGYLHDCERARKIAESWLDQSGWLSNPAKLNELGIILFQNIAPLAPGYALQAIESAALGKDGANFLSPEFSNRWKWAALLRSIAYEPEQFDQATILLARFFAAEPADYNHNSSRDVFKELFHLYLSGTHAPVEQRIAVIRKLLEGEDVSLQKCALVALDAMLEAWHFHSSHDFSFGARSRDFGWEPKTREEEVSWYRAALGLARELAFSTSPHAMEVQGMLARHFRSLWMRAGISHDLESLAKTFADHGGWSDGWIAIRSTIGFDKDRMPPEVLERLRSLESCLRPQDLIEKVHAYVLSRTFGHWDIVDGEEGAIDTPESNSSAWGRFNQIVEELGKEVAVTPQALTQLLPQLLQKGDGQYWQFGRGLAQGTQDLVTCWQQMYDVLASLPEDKRDVSLMRGFIEAANFRAPETTNDLLDQAISDPVLGPFFPLLQTAIPINKAGVERLVSSFAVGLAKVWRYRFLGYGRVSDAVPALDFKRMVLGVADLPDGFSVAVDIFSMRLHAIKNDKLDIPKEILALGRELLIRADFQSSDDNFAYHLNEIAAACLTGEETHEDSLRICTNFIRALRDYRSGARHYHALASTLFKLQPKAALKSFFSQRKKEQRSDYLEMFYLGKESPVNSAPPEVLLEWAAQNRAVRIPLLAGEIDLFDKNGGQQIVAWSPIALRLLTLAVDRMDILDIFASRFRPQGCFSSLADVLKPYLQLVKKLKHDNDPLILAWMQRQEISLMRQIEVDRECERHIDESFE